MRAPMITDEEAWVNWGMRPPGRKEIQILKPVMIDGMPHNVGDVVTVRDNDAFSLIASGKATSYPPPAKDGESPGDQCRSGKEALKSGPYRVEITQPCFVQGMHCEPGETISLGEEDALCLESSTRGRIVGRPPEEDIRERIARIVEEMLRGAGM